MPDTVTQADLLREAMSLHRQGRLGDAAYHYDRLLQEDPDHRQALRLRGILARDDGEPLLSVRLHEYLCGLAPDDANAAGELALSHMAAGDLRAAAAAFRKSLGIDPDSTRTLANYGALLQRLGSLDAAIDTHRRCLANDPSDLEVRCNLANALMDAGRPEEAVAECEAALRIVPGHPLLLAALGATLCGAGRFGEAVETLQPLAERDDADEMALINLAFALRHTDRDEDAIAALCEAMAVNPDNARAVADLGHVLISSGDARTAAEVCADFLRRFPGERLVVATYGYALLDAGRADEARALFDFARFVDVRDVDAPAGYDSLAAFNAGLAGSVTGHRSLIESPARKATTGGAQTGELGAEDGRPLAAFETLVRGHVADYAARLAGELPPAHPALAGRCRDPALRIWGTVLRAGGRQSPHLHPMAWLGGVYYPALPGDLGSSGALRFGCPPPTIRLTTGKPDTLDVQPVVGRLVLFPAYLYHETLAFQSDDARVSLAFDVVPR